MSKILTFDIGSGTLDILLWDSEKNIENCIKLVVPSPNVIMTQQIENFPSNTIKIDGYTVGGGKCSWTIKNHLKNGKEIIMTPEVAKLVRDDLDVVRSLGVKVVDKIEDPDFFLKEIDFEFYKTILNECGEDFNDIEYFGFALQDHGCPPKGVSDRKFRFEQFSSFLENSKSLLPFLFEFSKVPDDFLRMKSFRKSVIDQLGPVKGFIIDTSPAAIAGCFEDETVQKISKTGKPLMLVNFGNKHTMVTILKNGKVEALFEHHTFMLRKAPDKISYYLTGLANGTITTEEVFDDMGNGAIIYNKIGIENIEKIVVTGPNRNMINHTDFDYYYAAPGGDMMITGPLGVISLIKEVL